MNDTTPSDASTDHAEIEDVLLNAFDTAIQTGALISRLDGELCALAMATVAQDALRDAGYAITQETPAS